VEGAEIVDFELDALDADARVLVRLDGLLDSDFKSSSDETMCAFRGRPMIVLT